MQISDVIMLFSFVIYTSYKKKVKTASEDLYLRQYIVLVVMVNIVHSIINWSLEFEQYTLYYIFNYMIIVMFENYIENPRFRKTLGSVIKLSLCTQALVYLSGRGRWYMEERYQGTFNDPNQYAFFLLCCVLLIVVLSTLEGKRRRAIPWMVLGFAIFTPSASIGSLVGFVALFSIFVVFGDYKQPSTRLAAIIVFVTVIVLLILIGRKVITMPDFIEESYTYQRFVNKLNTILEGKTSSMDERGWNKVFNNPWMMLVGAGEGLFGRFAGSGKEVHSSLLGPLFYYGVIPFLYLLRWHIIKLRGTVKSVWCVYISLISESVFLVNTRQPMYWMLMVLAGRPELKSSEMVERLRLPITGNETQWDGGRILPGETRDGT